MPVTDTRQSSTDTAAPPDGATGAVEVSSGARLAYRDAGAGEPVLMIMGVAGSLGIWGPFESALADSHRAISFDNRGLGASTRGEDEITMASMVDDAIGLLDALELDRVHVVGWSLGSAVAQELALRHPDRVASLVLYGTWGRMEGFQATVLGALRYPWDNGDLESALGAFALGFSAELLDSPEFPELLERFLPLFPQTSAQVRVVSEQWATVFAHDTLDRLAQITAPALVVSGEQDLLTPRRQCDAVAAAIPDAALVHVDGPGASHALHLERTRELARAVTAFLERHPLR